MSPLIDAHLHVWDGSAAGKDPGPFPVGYSPQSQAPVELFQDYMDEAGVERSIVCGFPSSDNEKSSCARSRTGLPSLSVTITSTLT